MNKAIYQPKGAAGEYAKYACNFYVGCSNGCTYCYCKKGVLSSQLGGDAPKLKKCFKDESHAMEVFEKELKANLPEIQKHGLFFSFTTDPMLPETIDLTIHAMDLCMFNDVPVKVLTKVDITDIEKKIGFDQLAFPAFIKDKFKDKIAFGFTLTGHDELEPGASMNDERIEAMRKLHEVGFKTFASIEPVIDFESSMKMIDSIYGICDLYKIGLMSGKKYDKDELTKFLRLCIISDSSAKIYFKDSLLKQAGIDRSELPNNCVTRDYNLFQ